MRKKHLFRFNLIEIILAMGVVALGMTAVMALLPPVLNANRDAAGDVIAAEAVSKMITYIDMQARFVKQTDDNEWKTNINDVFASSGKKFNEFSDGILNSKDGTALPVPFACFVSKGNGLYNYILQENNEDYCAANVMVWKEDIPNPHNFGSGGTPRPGYRFFIKISWPGEAPAGADFRQERSFVYDVLRPAVQ